MNPWSNADLLLFAKLCDAAYLTDSEARVEALGVTFIAQLDTLGCQCTIGQWGYWGVCAYAGTHVSQNLSLSELFDDLDGSHVVLPGNLRVARGFWQPLEEAWPKIDGFLPLGKECIFLGHSLGGAHAHLSKALWKRPQATEIVSFGAPVCADQHFWSATYANSVAPVRVVHEHDFAPDWHPLGFEIGVQPGPMAWLHGGQLIDPTYRRGGLPSVEDHGIQNYISALKAVKP